MSGVWEGDPRVRFRRHRDAHRRARLFSAAGSANETRHALRQAVAWEIIAAKDAEKALGLLQRLIAMLWKMTWG